jgi:hypothetical protein
MADYNINAITRRVVYTGSAGLGPYAFSFEIIDQADVGVYFNQTALTLSSDYTVTINANGTGSVNIITGGNVPSTPTANDTIIIIGARDIERTTDFVTAGDLLASSLNEQLDSNIIFEQQIDERVDRSIKFPVFDSFTGDNVLPAAATRADKILKFDSSGNIGVETASALFSGAVVGSNFVNNTFTGDGSQTAFTTTVEAGSKNNAQVYIDGVYQLKSSFSVSGTTLTFTEAPPLNSQIEVIIGKALTSVTGDASGMDYTQGGTGSVQRTVESKLQDVVSVKDFGATGDGATDDLAAFHAAMTASKNVFVPAGFYYLSGTLETKQTGQRLIGNDSSGTAFLYPTHLGGITVRNTFTDFEIAHLFIYVRDSSGGANDGTAFYHAGGAWLNMHDCTIYNPDATGNSGTGIVLDDRDAAGSFVPGSYTHNIYRINMARGNFLATGIKTAGTSGGINASRITNCHIISDNCIEWNFGGGNLIQGNLLQTSTGTLVTPAGKGYNSVSAGSNMLVGNYMEKFAYDVYNGSTITGGAPIVSNHHSDNSAAVNGFGGGSSTMPFFVDQNGVHNLTLYEDVVAVTANSQAIPTNQAVVRIAGNGVVRETCTLSTSNARNGQMLYLRGDSWAVQVVESTTADFGPYGSNDGLIFGTAGSSIAISGVTRPLLKSALFMYRSASSKWELLEATAHRHIGGNYEAIDVLADSTAIQTDAAKIFITGAGAARSNCTLEAPVVDGQTLVILAPSWAVTIIPSTTAVFESAAASVTFSGTTSNVQAMNLIAYNGKWYETGRAVT